MAWILGLVALYLLLMFLVAWVSIHPPRLPVYLSPSVMGAPQEAVQFSPDGLRGWWVEGGPDVAVFAHGYLMNRSELAPVAYKLWKEGMSCLLIDMRGHGRSPAGKVTFGLEERHDVRAAVAFARERKPGGKIALVGSSMGSAASALAMGDDPAMADVLVLDSCYGRLASAILGWWRFLGGKLLMALLWPTAIVTMPLAGFNPFQVDVSRALARLESVPVLILHGECDDLALPSEALHNFDSCPGPKRLVWFPRSGHSEFRWEQADLYYTSLIDFLREHGLIVGGDPVK
jgi:pimeloyl-ACP methyl ester carboxylesterase